MLDLKRPPRSKGRIEDEIQINLALADLRLVPERRLPSEQILVVLDCKIRPDTPMILASP